MQAGACHQAAQLHRIDLLGLRIGDAGAARCPDAGSPRNVDAGFEEREVNQWFGWSRSSPAGASSSSWLESPGSGDDPALLRSLRSLRRFEWGDESLSLLRPSSLLPRDLRLSLPSKFAALLLLLLLLLLLMLLSERNGDQMGRRPLPLPPSGCCDSEEAEADAKLAPCQGKTSRAMSSGSTSAASAISTWMTIGSASARKVSIFFHFWLILRHIRKPSRMCSTYLFWLSRERPRSIWTSTDFLFLSLAKVCLLFLSITSLSPSFSFFPISNIYHSCACNPSFWL